MNMETDYADKLETLMQEARGEKSKDEEFDANLLTRVIQDEGEVLILQLKDKERGGPVWKRTKIPNRQPGTTGAERSTPLLMAVPKDVNKPEGGLVVT